MIIYSLLTFDIIAPDDETAKRDAFYAELVRRGWAQQENLSTTWVKMWDTTFNPQSPKELTSYLAALSASTVAVQKAALVDVDACAREAKITNIHVGLMYSREPMVAWGPKKVEGTVSKFQ